MCLCMNLYVWIHTHEFTLIKVFTDIYVYTHVNYVYAQ